MSLHDSDITSRFARFLDRKLVPKRLEGKAMAQDDEMRALIAKITSNAPRGADALAAWWPQFETELSEACGDFWPTEKLIKHAARKATEASPKLTASTLEIDMSDAAVAARKMQRGDAVAEGALWGIVAVEIAARGLVNRETMDRYRSAAFLNRCIRMPDGSLDKDAALRWEAERKQAHEDAKRVWQGRGDDRQQRDAGVPDMGVPYAHDFAAE